MLSDVMTHFGLTKSLRHVDYFETEHHRQLLKDLKAAIHEGGIVFWTYPTESVLARAAHVA